MTIAFKLAIAREYLTTDIDSVRLGTKIWFTSQEGKFFVTGTEKNIQMYSAAGIDFTTTN